ncbi:MAG: MBL fold metallo-hydrolase [Chitinophagales bacterium]|nr:MBL fold metallo-hydrolase [Chitinophagales bacterium]
MKVEQIYTGCLAEAAYYIESNGEVAIIDPLREVQPYIEKAKANNATIKYVLETHFHADFVSGHIDLAEKTGATIVYGPNAETGFDAHVAKDNEILPLGNIKIKVLHTPGHTMESTSYLLLDENDQPFCVFTGDTLFIGDVGRPDLAIKTNLTREDLAGHLYDSLHNKIMVLPDDVIIYPGHGAGSACGKNMSKETFSTLGEQKQNNYALKAENKAAFIKEVTTGLTTPPQYFPKNAMMNKQGYESIDSVFNKGLNALSADEFENIAEETHALILDTRNQDNYAQAHIPQSINIGIDGQFAPWVGALITDIKQPILIVCDEGRAEDVITRLARVGYDNTLGYLDGGIDAWKAANKETDAVDTISAADLASLVANNNNISILDVRKPSEYDAEHIVNAENKPLDYINDWMPNINHNDTYYIHCAGGYRSMTAASILKARGFHNLVDVTGGFNAIASTDIPKTAFVCPSTLK